MKIMGNARAWAVLAFAVLAFMLPQPAPAADAPEIPGYNIENSEPTGVIINSDKWQDAYLASIYANYYQYTIRYIQDPFQSPDFMRELTTHKFTKVQLFSRKDSKVPSLTYLLHAQNLDVRETVFADHFDLSSQMLQKIPVRKVILVRDDFAFDALSAKYLAQKIGAVVVFSRGAQEMDERVMAALSQYPPEEIYLIGRPSEKLEGALSNFKLVKLQGRDEFDTNNKVNAFALEGTEMNQSVVSTGDVLELLLMNLRGQPIFLVPEYTTYSLPRSAAMITDAKMNVLLGLGRFVTESGSWLKDQTKTKLIVKFGTVRTRPQEGGMVQKDVTINLEGYELPKPVYNGSVIEIDPSYAEPLGPATGALVSGNRPPAPPVEFRNVFENSGNIDFPAYIILEIRDKQDSLITTLQSEKQMVYPGRLNIFKVKWDNPPAEGTYKVEAKVFGDVYEGLTLPGRKTEFDLNWMVVFFNLLLLLIAILMLGAAIWSSQMLVSDMRKFAGAYGKAVEQLEYMRKYVAELYHFRGKKTNAKRL